MCSRYENSAAQTRLAIAGEEVVAVNPYVGEVRPTNPALIVCQVEGMVRPREARWGWETTWSTRPLINARSETAATKPTFKASWLARRCLVPATGWFEWREIPGAKKKQRWGMKHANDEPFCMAGLWVRDDAELFRFVILTREAAPDLVEIHDRMPLIVPPTEYATWLGRSDDTVPPAVTDGWAKEPR